MIGTLYFMPKGPFRTKKSTESKVTTARKKATAIAKRHGECSEVLAFLGKRGRKTVRIVKTTAVAQYYGFGRRTIFSTEGSFGWKCAKGAAKASCGETVVQKGVFGESVSTLPP